MLYPEVSKLMKGMDSRYSLVIATAKRARQLAADVSDDKPVSHAIAEIAAGKIKCIKKGEAASAAEDADAGQEVSGQDAE